jgi:rhodanese-related sulfurtransferase
MHRPKIARADRIVDSCAAGARSIVGARALVDRSHANVFNLAGGFAAPKTAG